MKGAEKVISDLRSDFPPIDHFFTNMTNSEWQAAVPERGKETDWVTNYFVYPKRVFLDKPYPNTGYYQKKVFIPDWYILKFVDSLNTIGIVDFIALEAWDCDSWSKRPDSIHEVFISIDDFEQHIKPCLDNHLELDYIDVVGVNSPNRVVLLGDKPIKQGWLWEYWEMVGADTREKKVWNTPTYEQMKEVLGDKM